MEIKHDAFISYNHHLDHVVAKALEDGMERLAKPLLSLRAIDVFRDETALSANPDLWARIVDHLSGTAWLIVLACPEWTASPWCGREVQWWLENRSTDRMLIAGPGNCMSSWVAMPRTTNHHPPHRARDLRPPDSAPG